MAGRRQRSRRFTGRAARALALVAGIAAAAWAHAQTMSVPAPEAPSATAPGTTAGATPALGQAGTRGWTTEAAIRGQATLTNNANYGTGAERQADLILEAEPSIRFSRRGGRLQVEGDVALNLIGYADNTQVSRILPRANVLANLEAIDDFFFVDSSLTVTQGIENPFLARSFQSSTSNLFTTTQVRVAPYIRGSFGPRARWLVRSDNSYTWTSQTNSPLSNAYYARNLAEIVRDPTPVGLTLRVTNDVTRIQNQVQPDQTLNAALAILDYAFSPQFRVGLRGGYENTNYTATETSGPIYGANLTWRPSPLTSVDGYWESRFYGPSYRYGLTNRQRLLATSLTGYRTISTYPQVLLQIPSTSNVAALLDAILLARFPDPIDRAQQAQDLITRQGLPSSLPQGAFVYNFSANVLTSANLGWALIGARNTLALNLFYLKTEYLPDARIPPTFLVFNNSIQRGGTVSLSHRLSPVLTANGTVFTRYTTGFDQNEGLHSRDSGVTLQATWQANARSSLFVGARYQQQSDTSPVLSGFASNETAVYAGIFHRL